MKRFLILLLLFCNTVCADTINLHWKNYDGTTYQDSTCEIDSDLILPSTTPTRYGYTFTGWKITGYVPIEYIQSTGVQYIDTGASFTNSNIEIIGRYGINSVPVSGEGEFVSSVFGNGQFMAFGITGSQIFAYSKGDSNVVASAYQGILDIIARYDFNTKKKYVTVNNNTVEGSYQHSISNSSAPITLFANPDGAYKLSAKLYYIKLYNNNVLIRDFIPVLDRNGTPCLFDTVKAKFYYNKGTGQFIAGPVLQ